MDHVKVKTLVIHRWFDERRTDQRVSHQWRVKGEREGGREREREGERGRERERERTMSTMSTMMVCRLFRAASCPFPFTAWPVCVQGPRHDSMMCTESRPAVSSFDDPEVQKVLMSMTTLNVEHIFRPVKQALQPPTYKVMTDKQLQEAHEKAIEKAKELLTPPPVLPERQPIDEVLSHDKCIAGLEASKYIFTDISSKISERERLIVVREVDGTLRKATWEERDRMMQIYFPREGRQLKRPPLFNDEHLQVHKRCYEDLAERGKHDLLKSTRYFPGFVWHLVLTKQFEGLLFKFLQDQAIEEAANLIWLFNRLHPESRSSVEASGKALSKVELIQNFAQTDAQNVGKIDLALQAYLVTTKDYVEA
uniref:Mitochondrial ribosomal protein S22 n=1 Tax=Eptatretus burgeri TaxID=7764 RepID=A0A8C4PWY6_EPTBU